MPRIRRGSCQAGHLVPMRSAWKGTNFTGQCYGFWSSCFNCVTLPPRSSLPVASNLLFTLTDARSPGQAACGRPAPRPRGRTYVRLFGRFVAGRRARAAVVIRYPRLPIEKTPPYAHRRRTTGTLRRSTLTVDASTAGRHGPILRTNAPSICVGFRFTHTGRDRRHRRRIIGFIASSVGFLVGPILRCVQAFENGSYAFGG